MTPEQLAARWLADVPRIPISDDADNGYCLREADAIAAIARLFAPGDDLVERLMVSHNDWCERNAKGCDPTEIPSVQMDAAARIAALTTVCRGICRWFRLMWSPPCAPVWRGWRGRAKH